ERTLMRRKTTRHLVQSLLIIAMDSREDMRRCLISLCNERSDPLFDLAALVDERRHILATRLDVTRVVTRARSFVFGHFGPRDVAWIRRSAAADCGGSSLMRPSW